MDALTLRQEFQKVYPDSGRPALCRAPGRINLIGEHTDYNGLPVLPMTLAQDIKIAFAPRRDRLVRMRNVQEGFAEATFQNGPALSLSRPGAWDNYCKAAVQALNRHYAVDTFPGMDMLVLGTIPVAAGLSSSSALVVACALAYLKVLGKVLDTDISRLDLATLLAEGEHFVGTQGGGMDQAIILLGSENSACKIDFFPLRVEQVPLPKDHAIIACHSLVKAEKTGDALHRYNEGPYTCRLIRALVERKARDTFGDEVRLERLGDLWQGHLCLTHDEVARLLDDTLCEERTTLAVAAQRLGMSIEEIRERWLHDLREPDGGFRLRARARHQLTEYRRVESARDALLADDPKTFGALMNDSHESCSNDYEVSCEELDVLVRIARRAGAWGARLTGAGFGGCTVNLVPRDTVNSFTNEIQKAYYDEYMAGRGVTLRDSAILVARAGAGAGYIAVA